MRAVVREVAECVPFCGVGAQERHMCCLCTLFYLRAKLLFFLADQLVRSSQCFFVVSVAYLFHDVPDSDNETNNTTKNMEYTTDSQQTGYLRLRGACFSNHHKNC